MLAGDLSCPAVLEEDHENLHRHPKLSACRCKQSQVGSSHLIEKSHWAVKFLSNIENLAYGIFVGEVLDELPLAP